MFNLKSTQVFTPKWATNEMLDLLNQDDLASEGVTFFEPSCGDGQMLEVIFERVYEALVKKHGCKERALAGAMLKFYAIDLDPEMVIRARFRIYEKFKTMAIGLDEAELLNHLIAHIVVDKIEIKDFFETMDQLKCSVGHFKTPPLGPKPL